jgi:hypothetical protein
VVNLGCVLILAISVGLEKIIENRHRNYCELKRQKITFSKAIITDDFDQTVDLLKN